MASSNGAGRGRKSTSFMRQLVQLISDHPDVISFGARVRKFDSPPSHGSRELTRVTLYGEVHAGSTRTGSSSSRAPQI